MTLIDIFVVLSKLFALIKFIVTYDCDVNSHLFFFFTVSAFSPKFGKLFGEVSFRQGGFSAKWLFGEVVFGKVSCIDVYYVTDIHPMDGRTNEENDVLMEKLTDIFFFLFSFFFFLFFFIFFFFFFFFFFSSFSEG